MKSKFRTISIASIVSAVLLTGCATSQKIQVVQKGDADLTCEGIRNQFAKLDESQASVEDNKGVTGTNVASVLFWLPGLAYTYYDAGQAEQLITDRRSYLTEIANSKNCP